MEKRYALYRARLKSKWGVRSVWKSANLKLLEETIAHQEELGYTVITGIDDARIEKMSGRYVVEPNEIYVDVV